MLENAERGVTSLSPAVSYTYAVGSTTNYIRLTNVQNSVGSTNTVYGYGTSNGIDDKLSRVQTISKSSSFTIYTTYTYLGAGTVVQVALWGEVLDGLDIG